MLKKITAAAIIFTVVTGVYIFEVKPRLQAYEYVRNMPIGAIDLSKIADGVREGSFSLSDISCKVKVTVKSNKIESVEIVENATNDLAKKAEKVAGNVLAAQSLQVECVTGATATSKAILKAVENALKK
jgi:uncharacterized protein with FMN-binding domain